jgi:hypothetical protein
MAASRDGGDHAIWSDSANDAIVVIGNVKIPRRVYEHIVRAVQRCLYRRPSVASVCRDSVPRNCADLAIGADFPDAVVSVVGEIDVACHVHRDADGQV